MLLINGKESERTVFAEDLNSPMFNLYLHKHGADFTLAQDTVLNSRIINLTAGHGLVVGDGIGLKENKRFFESEVTAVNVNAVTLADPLDYVFTVAGIESAHIHDHEMAVNGSVTPVTFHITPPDNTIWDVTRIIFQMTCAESMDSTTFGCIPSLANGCVLRKIGNPYFNIFNLKRNSDFILFSYDVEWDIEDPLGTFSFKCRSTFGGPDKRGVSVRLDADRSDHLELIVQDDLTGLVSFRALVQGHVFEPPKY